MVTIIVHSYKREQLRASQEMLGPKDWLERDPVHYDSL